MGEVPIHRAWRDAEHLGGFELVTAALRDGCFHQSLGGFI
jgi:hypothetical protein